MSLKAIAAFHDNNHIHILCEIKVNGFLDDQQGTITVCFLTQPQSCQSTQVSPWQ